MARFRRKIDGAPQTFLKAVAFYESRSPFLLEGEKYKRTLKPEHPAVIQDWYQRKSFYLTCQKPVDDGLFRPALVDDLWDGFTMLAPLYRYLWQI